MLADLLRGTGNLYPVDAFLMDLKFAVNLRRLAERTPLQETEFGLLSATVSLQIAGQGTVAAAGGRFFRDTEQGRKVAAFCAKN
nr:hypothetical protein [Aliamphritea spongicola]